jgi:hypothetical protein
MLRSPTRGISGSRTQKGAVSVRSSARFDRFIDLAERGLRLVAARKDAEAASILEEAEEIYVREGLGAEPGASETCVAIITALADAASARGEHALAVQWLVRSLATPSPRAVTFLRLVSTASAARRHGEARRYYDLYVRRMEARGEPASPFPGRGRPAG